MKRICVVLLLVFSVGCQFSNYSEGIRIGVVYKFNRKGFFCKTWEGTVNLGGMREETSLSSDGKSTTQTMVPNTWDFTIKDKDYAQFGPIVEKAAETGQTLKFTYQQEWPAYCDSEDGYFLTNVQTLK